MLIFVTKFNKYWYNNNNNNINKSQYKIKRKPPPPSSSNTSISLDNVNKNIQSITFKIDTTKLSKKLNELTQNSLLPNQHKNDVLKSPVIINETSHSKSSNGEIKKEINIENNKLNNSDTLIKNGFFIIIFIVN